MTENTDEDLDSFDIMDQVRETFLKSLSGCLKEEEVSIDVCFYCLHFIKTHSKPAVQKWSEGVNLNFFTLAARAQRELEKEGYCDDSLISSGELTTEMSKSLEPKMFRAFTVIQEKLKLPTEKPIDASSVSTISRLYERQVKRNACL
ncbi:Hypothetical_protein [Hexamita inflata]|uniref:Hypothetical_protein n=1 Tax=Hexamita inflata TaxID=28002 RepID=A0AA86RTN0_9EUKA|nr:Hypothetical protein HINF_LOCUS65364 [Hexamita inflata]